MPSLFIAIMARKAKVATMIISLTKAIFLLLYKTYHRLAHSSSYTCFVLVFHLLVVSLLLIYRTAGRNRTQSQTAPLSSFPSIFSSRPLFSFPSISSSPLFSFPSISSSTLFSFPSISSSTLFSFPSISSSSLFSFPSLSRQPRHDASAPVIPFDLKEPICISPLPQDTNVRLENDKALLQQNMTSVKLVLEPQEEEDESMDDTWNAILARGGAKPVKAKKSQAKRKIASKKKEELKGKEKEEGWRQGDEFVQRVETFIRKHYESVAMSSFKGRSPRSALVKPKF